MSEVNAQQVIELLLPQVREFLKSFSEGKISEAIQKALPALESGLWDKAVAEIGSQMNLPAQLIANLQTVDDQLLALKSKVDATKNEVEGVITQMISKVEDFKDRLKGVDLNQTVTMSYGKLKMEKIKCAAAWATITFFLGVLAGIVLQVLGFL